jgi:hypothetical protein
VSGGREALAPKMRAYADAHPGNDHLRELADKLDAAVADSFTGTPSVRKMLGAWARARRAWCEVTGEDWI